MSSSPEPFAPAGWYRDPLGMPQLRWWNGLMWTNQIEELHPEVQISNSYRVELVATP